MVKKGDSFYGYQPKFKIGEHVYIQTSKNGLLWRGQVIGIVFELASDKDGEVVEVAMYYDVEIEGLGGLYSFDESCLLPLNSVPKTIAKPENKVNYKEYTTDELLDAYMVFKQLAAKEKGEDKTFNKILTDIESQLKTRVKRGNRK